MGAYTIFDRIRDFIGGIGWDIFLWSIRLTQEQYLEQTYWDMKRLKEGEE